MSRLTRRLPAMLCIACFLGCSGGEEQASGRSGGRPGGPGGPGGGAFGASRPQQTAVPVQIATVEQRTISSYLETNGSLEAENEVDLVARVSGPIAQLVVEEGARVRKGDRVALIDDSDLRSQVEIARVNFNEAELAYKRAENLQHEELISSEEYTRAKTAYEAARAELDGRELELSYADVRAPFSGRIITRYVDLAQQVGMNDPLFRLSDFDPLLCPIQVPERDYASLKVGQRAYLTVEAWPNERFDAKVLRIRPVVDATTGTIRVTLSVDGRDRLRPGMFSSVYLEIATRVDTLVIPKSALALDSIGDTVYMAAEGVAQRRPVRLGFEEGDFVEILEGLQIGDAVVAIGQDGLSDGTPIQVLNGPGADRVASTPGAADAPAGAVPASQGGGFDLEQIRQRMRDRGMSDEQIETRIEQMRERFGEGGTPRSGAGGDAAQAGPGGPPREAGPDGGRPGGPGGRPDFATMTPEQLENVKARMRQRGMTEEQIEQRIARAREQAGQNETH